MASGFNSMSHVHQGIPFSRAASTAVRVSWGSGLWEERILKAWSKQDLKKLKMKTQKEYDPIEKRMAVYRGVRLKEVIEASMNQLSLDQKAQVDLIVLKNKKKQEIALPRWLLNKYSVLIAFLVGPQEQSNESRFYSVIPWTSESEIKREILPLEKFFLSDLDEVKLTNFKSYYEDELFLEKSSDPIAMRGQKRFVQTCMPCHRQTKMPSIQKMRDKIKTASEMENAHEKIKGFHSLDSSEHQALIHYLKKLNESEDDSIFSIL